jgi:PadR family transcriptional regulator PadR
MSNMMEHPAVRKFAKELNSGTVSLVLLTILARSDEPLYGYEIAKRLEQGAREKLPVKRGTLYPVLRSMEEKGLLQSRVEPSVSGPPRKYYSITDEGREVLAEWKNMWQQTLNFVDATLKGDVGGND